MAAYVIMVRDKLTDPEAFATYGKMAREARGDTPPKPLAFYGAVETLEGLEAEGAVLLEFPTMEAAKAWYHSPAYQAALPYRLKGAEYRVILVQGVEAPPAA
ncbi:MAG: DUF1330 domain-containing protein [Caulobacteraceae bacterium]